MAERLYQPPVGLAAGKGEGLVGEGGDHRAESPGHGVQLFGHYRGGPVSGPMAQFAPHLDEFPGVVEAE